MVIFVFEMCSIFAFIFSRAVGHLTSLLTLLVQTVQCCFVTFLYFSNVTTGGVPLVSDTAAADYSSSSAADDRPRAGSGGQSPAEGRRLHNYSTAIRLVQSA